MKVSELTVRELIAMLQELPQDALVVVPKWYGDKNEITHVGAQRVEDIRVKLVRWADHAYEYLSEDAAKTETDEVLDALSIE